MEPDYRDRTLFYWAKLYTSELKSGEEYGNLKQTITINIINFNMFEGQNYHTEVAAMIKGTNEVFSDKFSIHFFELKKISKHPKTSREQWLQFINADSMEDFEIVQATTNMPTIQKAVKVIYDMSEDTKIREIARLREKALHDEASALKQAKNEGIAMGRTDERRQYSDRQEQVSTSNTTGRSRLAPAIQQPPGTGLLRRPPPVRRNKKNGSA